MLEERNGGADTGYVSSGFFGGEIEFRIFNEGLELSKYIQAWPLEESLFYG
jgi:hypothetical protein